MIIINPKINSETEECRSVGDAVLRELGKIKSNEKKKIIQKEMLEITNDFDYESILQSSVLFLQRDSVFLGKSFFEECSKEKKKPCLIVFDALSRKYLYELVKSGFPKENILLVGARSFDREGIIFLSENKIRQVSINELSNDIEEMTDVIMEFASGKELCVLFGMGVIDPAFAPAAVCAEPGGLTSRQAIYIVSRMGMMKNLRIFNLSGIKSPEPMTIKLAAKLAAEIL